MAAQQIARDLTYASAAQGRPGRAMIRLMENATGRLGLIRRARGYDAELAAGADFWEVMTRRYGLWLEIAGGALELIPRSGPLIVVANHPYGILDGLILGHMLSARRGGDFRLMAHRVFRKSAELEQVILPISFDETKVAARQNLETRAEALRYLGQGGAIGIFPGGTVSTAARPFGPAMDPGWRNFTAKMIAKSDATVLPVYFEGANSRLFQIASHLHYTLRMGLLLREFRQRVDSPVRVVIGAPLERSALEPFRADAKACMDFLRKATYDLSPGPMDAARLGHEFEAKYKGRDDGGRNLRQRIGRADGP